MTKKFLFFLLLPCYAFALNIGIISDSIGFDNFMAPFEKNIAEIIEEKTAWKVHVVSGLYQNTIDGAAILENLLERYKLDAVVVTLGFEDIFGYSQYCMTPGSTAVNLKKMVRVANNNSIEILIGSIDFHGALNREFTNGHANAFKYFDYSDEELKDYADDAMQMYPYLKDKGAHIFPFLTNEVFEAHTLAKMNTTENENIIIADRIIEILEEIFPNKSEKIIRLY